MSLLQYLLCGLVLIAGLWAIYLLMFPALALLGRRCERDRSAEHSGRELPTVAVIVPAHNMEGFVGRCIGTLRACHYPEDRLVLYVVADHCSDATQTEARDAGASVLTREEGPRGKTFTLAWAFKALAADGIDPDVYVVVDATVRVAPGFLHALAARVAEGENIAVGHAIVDPDNKQWFAQAIGLSLAHRNLQNWSRERLQLSALVEGRGMAYSRAYIKRFGWSLASPGEEVSDAHPTEDWRHGVRAADQGLRVAYVDAACLFTPLRHSLGAATQQGIRWERGRTANAASYGIRLLMRGLQQRSRLKVVAGLDAIQPPVAVLGGFCIGLAVLSLLPVGVYGAWVSGLLPLGMLSVYALAVVERGRREGINPRIILWAPAYVGWRCVTFLSALAGIGSSGRPGRRNQPQ